MTLDAIPNGVVAGVVMGMLLGIFKLIAWYWNTRSEQAKREAAERAAAADEFGKLPDTGVQHVWHDTTGEHRPVLSSECAARYLQIKQELAKGSEKMAKLDTSIQEVKTELIKLQQQVGAEVELRIRSYADEAAQGAVSKHEKSVLHKSRSASGGYGSGS